jgi:SAM-dependent methyltransferase
VRCRSMHESMRKSKHLYDYPAYYETAFSFRDIHREAEVFDECFRRYSRIQVKRVLELGAGTAPHMEEWARRKIEYVGIDTNKKMLDYSRKKAEKLRIGATLLAADMRGFSLDRNVDFAYTMLGSLYAKTAEDVNSHLNSVANALNPGGLYFLDWCINFQWADPSNTDQSWSIEKWPLKIKVSFRTMVLDRADQTVRNMLTAKIDDAGKSLTLEAEDVVRTIFPQEFLLIVERSKKFEFLGWWNDWKLEEPIREATHISRPIVLLRRKGRNDRTNQPTANHQ